ncbi:MAG TPA: DUF2182 domain-containing protein [Candidatus Angelobacter sp.]|nr:DUF2182 domain-containing protein [Candidatus Angelobacter sp.]
MSATLSLPYSRWRQFLWRHPESPLLLLSAGAWLFLLAGGVMSLAPSLGIHSHDADAAATLHSSMPSESYLAFDAWPGFMLHWSIMITAMMFPTLVPQVRVVAARSLWFRRDRSMLLFLAGYSALWLVYGVTAKAVLQLLRLFSPAVFSFLLPFSLLLAGLWQLTRRKQRSLVACHFTMPMAPSGWRADFDCCRYGARTAAYCCISCWALMLVCVAAGHSLWAMLVVACVSLAERVLIRPRQAWFATALFAVALLALSAHAF